LKTGNKPAIISQPHPANCVSLIADVLPAVIVATLVMTATTAATIAAIVFVFI